MDVSDRANDNPLEVPTSEGAMEYQQAREKYEDNARALFRKTRRRLFDARVAYQMNPNEANERALTDARHDFAKASMWM